jgi:hypothetical protein
VIGAPDVPADCSSVISSAEWSESDFGNGDRKLVSAVARILVHIFQGMLRHARARPTTADTTDSTSKGKAASTTTTTQLTSDGGSSSSRSIPAKQQKRYRDGTRDDDDEEEKEDRPQKRGNAASLAGNLTRLLACPFHKFDCRKFGGDVGGPKYHSCATFNCVQIAHLKQHLQRVHCCPEYFCARCYTVFQSEGDLGDHLRTPSPCEIQPKRFSDMIGKDLRTSLALDKGKRNPAGMRPEAYWYQAYDAIFPGARANCNVTPYYNGPQSELLDQFRRVYEAVAGEVIQLIRSRYNLGAADFHLDQQRQRQEIWHVASSRFMQEAREAPPLQLGSPPDGNVLSAPVSGQLGASTVSPGDIDPSPYIVANPELAYQTLAYAAGLIQSALAYIFDQLQDATGLPPLIVDDGIAVDHMGRRINLRPFLLAQVEEALSQRSRFGFDAAVPDTGAEFAELLESDAQEGPSRQAQADTSAPLRSSVVEDDHTTGSLDTPNFPGPQIPRMSPPPPRYQSDLPIGGSQDVLLTGLAAGLTEVYDFSWQRRSSESN